MISSTTVKYDSRPAGSGKTYEQIEGIVRNPGLYLFAVDRCEIMPDRHRSLLDMAEAAGVRIHTIMINSQTAHSVRVEIEALPSTYVSGHVVCLITHAGMQSADLSAFMDWHCVIDEVPALFDRCTVNSSISGHLVERLFEIVPQGDLNHIRPRTKLNRRDLVLDTLASPLATLQSRASDRRNQIVTHLSSWAELTKNPRWTWWSIWSPAQLEIFSSVVVLAAGFDRSLTYDLCRSLAPELEWSPVISKMQKRDFAPRKLSIRYFAEGHVATRRRFDSPAGQDALNKIAGHLASRSVPRIWTCNLAERNLFSARLRAGYLAPKQAGSNSFAHFDEAVVIYTSKPDLHERKILTALHVDPNAVVESREFDTIYQFVARTSLRDPFSTRDVVAYVYDRIQAEALAAAFEEHSGITLNLELVDLGFAHDVPLRRNCSSLTDEELAERRRTQARDRKRQQRLREAMNKNGSSEIN